MRRFRFSLERLLWLRRLKETLSQQALARSLDQQRGVLRELERTRREAVAEATQLQTALCTCITGEMMRLHSDYAGALARRQARLAERRAEIGRQVATDRRSVEESWRAREAVARLRGRALTAYRKAVDREEQLLLDEAAGVRYLRRPERVDAVQSVAGGAGKEVG